MRLERGVDFIFVDDTGLDVAESLALGWKGLFKDS